MTGRWRVTTALMIACLGPAVSAAVPLTVNKTQVTVWDPIDLALLPKAVPGAQVDYTISVTNPLTQYAVAKFVSIKDAIPVGTKLYVGNLDSASGGPVVFSATLSNLVYTFTSLSNAVDSIEFSKDGGTSWTYSPVADSDGCDALVTNIRVSPTGNQGAAETFSIRFRTIVK